MFHSRVIGAKSANLDGFFFSPNTLRHLLAVPPPLHALPPSAF